MRKIFFALTAAMWAFGLFCTTIYHGGELLWLAIMPWTIVGVVDLCQKRHTIRRNFPVIGHARYLMEMVRPEISQYFIESNKDGVPFDRERRSLIYQRAKNQVDSLPFGTQSDVYAGDYEWINHSLAPGKKPEIAPRVHIGGGACKQPYIASLLNASAMSYGSLSAAAVRAVGGGAKRASFSQNTGEGGLSPYHLESGADLVWQLGTAYFGCRDKAGNFDPQMFASKAVLPQVKMIEVKLSQGAKPGHGGILPASKLTPEIVKIRNVEPGQDVLSPPAHTAFTTPVGLLHFVAKLRELSGGKPIGFKLCVGKRREFLAIVKAMLDSGIMPDFITVDGAEGGTGAAPVEFTNSVGTPLKEGLTFVHNALRGANLRQHIRIIAAGKVSSGFSLATQLALGADLCNAARAMMLSMGCIQALRCNTNSCPTGIATQDPDLQRGLDVPDKAQRVASFHGHTVHALLDVVSAAGLDHPSDLRPWHIMRRTAPTEARNYHDIYPLLPEGFLLAAKVEGPLARAWAAARPDTFAPRVGDEVDALV